MNRLVTRRSVKSRDRRRRRRHSFYGTAEVRSDDTRMDSTSSSIRFSNREALDSTISISCFHRYENELASPAPAHGTQPLQQVLCDFMHNTYCIAGIVTTIV